MDENWLSNTYLVADELGSDAVMIDAGGPVEPLLRSSSGCVSSSRTCS